MLLLYHILSLQHNLFWHCSASCLFSQLRNCSPMPEYVHYPTLGWFDFSQSYLREGKSQYFFQLDFAALHSYFTHFELTSLPRNHLAVCKQNLAFTHELQHDKTHKMMCAPSEDSRSVFSIHSLIWVFAGHTGHFVGFVMLGLTSSPWGSNPETVGRDHNWAASWQNQQNECAPSEDLDQPGHTQAKTLIRLGGCPGWSESLLGAQSLCWFCHVVAPMSPVMRKPVFGGLLPGKTLICLLIYSPKILDLARIGIILSSQWTTKGLIRLRRCTGWSVPLLFAYDINRFSHDVAHVIRSQCQYQLTWRPPWTSTCVKTGLHWRNMFHSGLSQCTAKPTNDVQSN